MILNVTSEEFARIVWVKNELTRYEPNSPEWEWWMIRTFGLKAYGAYEIRARPEVLYIPFEPVGQPDRWVPRFEESS